MKKRIISLILVAVMSVLALASCGYSFAEDDLSVYAAFSDKTAFEEALKKLVIEDGDFTTDAETRANQVLDSIYADLAAAVKDTAEEKTEGVLSGHDILYYCYYATTEFDGKEVVVFAQNMKPTSSASVQQGLGDPSNLEEKLLALVAGVDLKDKVYSIKDSGEYAEGDVVYVSYSVTVEKDVTDDDGGAGTVTDTVDVSNERLTLTKDASALVNHILDKKKSINSTLDTLEVDGKKYKNIKVNFVAQGQELGTVEDVTYTETKKVTDTNGESRDLKDKTLTYHVYPVHYLSVPEYTATNLINDILGSSITTDSVISIIFGRDKMEEYNEIEDEDEREKFFDELTKEYSFKEDDKDVALDTFIEALAKLQKELESAKKSLDSADKALEEKKTAYEDAVKAQEEAQKKFDEALAKYTEDASEANKKAHDTAKTALDSAKTKVETTKKAYEGDAEGKGGAVETQADAKKKYDEALTKRDAKVTALLTVKEDMESKLTEGYKTATYDYLLNKYNEEIRMNLAAEIWKLIEEKVTVTGTPDKAVDATYKQLIENYEYEFYNGTYDTSASVSNYKQYKGSFKNYLIDTVKTDMETTVKTYDEALTKVREKAQELVTPVVKIYVVAKAFDCVMTDKEFDEYKEDTSNNYDANVYNYGETSVLHAFQFDKLMNHFLEYEEAEDGSYKYNDKIGYTFAE